MKIEIGESLAQSWLKHVKGCQVVQLNWKAKIGPGMYEMDLAAKILEDAMQPNQYREELIKIKPNNTTQGTLLQFLRQAEIDAFGVQLTANDQAVTTKLYTVDVAFHTNGVSGPYLRRIPMKLIRSALALLTTFNVKEGLIAFAAPTIGPSMTAKLEDLLKEVQDLFEPYGLKYEFDLYANDKFRDELLLPTIEKSREDSDTAELFLRSTRLLSSFELLKVAPATPALSSSGQAAALSKGAGSLKDDAASISDLWSRVRKVPTEKNELKIGAALQLIFHRLDAQPDEFAALQRVLRTSEKELHLSKGLTVLRPYSDGDDIDALRKDGKGYDRYYAPRLSKHKSLLCSQWIFDTHHTPFTKLFKEANII